MFPVSLCSPPCKSVYLQTQLSHRMPTKASSHTLVIPVTSILGVSLADPQGPKYTYTLICICVYIYMYTERYTEYMPFTSRPITGTTGRESTKTRLWRFYGWLDRWRYLLQVWGSAMGLAGERLAIFSKSYPVLPNQRCRHRCRPSGPSYIPTAKPHKHDHQHKYNKTRKQNNKKEEN